ncbi:hypothetical protein HBI81_147690 [Parastagonospora nodorum]|nr:hypothetical protein HBI81_147690 [Parastagonospora nodorum]
MKDVERRNFHSTMNASYSPIPFQNFAMYSATRSVPLMLAHLPLPNCLSNNLPALHPLLPIRSNACPLASNPVRLIKPAGATSAKLCTRDVRVAAYPTASAPPNEYPTTCADAQDKWSSKSSISPWNRPETCGTSGVSLSPWPQWSKSTMCALGK